MGACLSRPGDLVSATADTPSLTKACCSDVVVCQGGSASSSKDEEVIKSAADGEDREQQVEQIENVQSLKPWNTKLGLPHQSLFLGPPTPPCEEQRLATVRALGLVDSPPDPELDSILKLIMSIFQAPNALVALFEDRRIFVKEARGAFQRGDFPWRYSFCAWTMASEQDQVMVIPDATKDARFVDNKFVQADGGVRFYCGAPLIASNGHRLGCICFADCKARPEFDGMQASIMGNMAEMVVRHVEKDIALQLRTHDNAALTNAYTQLKRAVDCFEHCVVLLDTSQPNWRIVYTNLAWDKITGCNRDNVRNVDLNEVLELASGELPSAAHRDAVAAEKQLVIEDVMVRTSWLPESAQGGGGGGISKQGSKTLFERRSHMASTSQTLSTLGCKKLVLKLRPATKSGIDENALALAVPSFAAANTLKRATDAPRLHLYFMTVEPMEVAKPNTLLSARGSITSRNSSNEDSGGCPVEGLQLGQLLGKGGFGTVYSGSWFGTAVAVKLIDQDMRNMAQQGGVCLEALLGAEMRHPHIVNLLTYVVRRPNNNTSTQSFAFSDDTARTGASSTMTAFGNNNNSSMASCAAPPPSPFNFGGVHAPRNLSQAGGAASAAHLLQPSASALPVINSGTPAAAEPEPAQLEFVAVVPQGPGSTTLSPLSPMHSVSSKAAASGAQHCTSSKADTGEQPTKAEEIKVVCMPDSSASGSSGANSAAANSSSGGGYAMPPGAALMPAGFAEMVQQSGDCWSTWGRSAQPPLVDMLSAQNSRAHTVMGSGSGFSHAQTWIVMEYCDRGCLQDAVDRGWLRTDPSLVHGAVRMEAVLATAHEVASAMLYLHSHSIVHGDLSAWNVLLTTSGTGASVAGRGFVAKVADFGLSRSLDIKTRVQTRTYGTITHQPPETLASGIISRETDTFSLGVLLWQMYTGSRPWVGLNHAQIIMTVASRCARLTFPDDTPEDYAALAYACMSYNAEERPSMAEVCRTLEALKLRYDACA